MREREWRKGGRVEGGRVEEGNERGRDGTRHGRSEGKRGVSKRAEEGWINGARETSKGRGEGGMEEGRMIGRQTSREVL